MSGEEGLESTLHSVAAYNICADRLWTKLLNVRLQKKVNSPKADVFTKGTDITGRFQGSKMAKATQVANSLKPIDATPT